MNPSDFFFISASVAIWLTIITWIFIFYKIARFISKTELQVQTLKNNLKLSGLTLLSKLLGIVKGGEK